MNPVAHTGPEKRITFQLYNYWFGLAGDDGIPPLKSLRPEDIAPYRNNMVLIDLRDPASEPTLQVVGQLLQEDAGSDLTLQGVSDIPRRTLLSRITDHYMEVLANQSPISFDAEFKNKARARILYRGILLPFSDDGETINFILGAIRWISEEERTVELAGEDAAAIADDVADSGPAHDSEAALHARLDHCRKLAKGKSPADLRSRKSLYRTLGAILDFYELATAHPEAYHALLTAEGLKAQARAPFTPALKLCFGRDHDKTRLTEYAAALAHARAHHQTGEALPQFLENLPGGIKGCVRAERQARNGESGVSPLEKAREIIGHMPPIGHFDSPKDSPATNELCLVLARRDGPRMDVIKILNEEEKLLEPILKRLAKDP